MKKIIFYNKINGDEKGGEWAEIHVCMDCYMHRFGKLPGVVEK